MISLGAAVAAAAAAVASARWNWWRLPVKGMPSLMYHKIGDAPPGTVVRSIWSTEREFRAQLEYLKRNGYTTLRFRDWRDAELGKIPMPAKPALITFDDGFANNHELALPILREMGMKANLFMVTGRAGGDSSWDSAVEKSAPIKMLTWAQLREMQDSGVFEIASHTVSHRDLLKLPLGEVRRELSESKTILEAELGSEVLGFAYPWGQGADDPAIRELVRETGYRYDFGTRPGISPLPWAFGMGALMRIEPVGGIDALDFHLQMTRGKSRIGRRYW